MYSYQHNTEKNLLVCRLYPGGDEDSDFGEHVDRMLEACKAVKPGEPSAAILVILDTKHSLPSAGMRKKIAQITAAPNFTPSLMIVTKNPMVRGVLTALSWLRKTHYKDNVATTTERGIAWLEEQRKTPLPELKIMIEKVLQDSTSSAA